MASQREQFPEVAREYEKVSSQLKRLVRLGHEVQLHIHPHWENSNWVGKQWVMNTSKFSLRQFPPEQIASIIHAYKAHLEAASGSNTVVAYRAGGLDVQPFSLLANALDKAGIRIDSSVCCGVVSPRGSVAFDFSGAPEKGAWRFSEDVLVEVPDGIFLEVPIASTKIPRYFKLLSAVTNRLKLKRHKAWGDGSYVKVNPSRRFNNMIDDRLQPVTIDGYKAAVLKQAYHSRMAKGLSTFVILGHPKAITPYALEKLDDFLKDCRPDICGLNDLLKTT
jgi:peptidoglycan/xylan/chitin deacetylase (PgdA/CDA1 family)